MLMFMSDNKIIDIEYDKINLLLQYPRLSWSIISFLSQYFSDLLPTLSPVCTLDTLFTFLAIILCKSYGTHAYRAT